MKKLISNFLILILLFSSPTFSSDKKQEDYELIEKIITQGKIIHKRTKKYYGDAFDLDPRSRSAQPETWDSLAGQKYTLELFISYKKKLYSCVFFATSGHTDLAFKEGWDCDMFLEKNK